MASCENCYLFDQEKLQNAAFFETRRETAMFILNVILNINKFHSIFCQCDNNNICYPCYMKVIYEDEEEVYEVYKNCLDLHFLLEVKAKLYEHLCKMQRLKNHFLCKITQKQFHYKHKCFFTGYNYKISLEIGYSEWENIKIKEIVNKNVRVNIFDFLRQKGFILPTK